MRTISELLHRQQQLLYRADLVKLYLLLGTLLACAGLWLIFGAGSRFGSLCLLGSVPALSMASYFSESSQED